eukprot:6817448-Pyramimonas_sp.AAC.1
MKNIQKVLKRLDKANRHPLPHMTTYPRDPLQFPPQFVEMACGDAQPVRRDDLEAAADKILSGPKFKRNTASSFKARPDSGGAQGSGAGAMVPFAPA